MNEREVIEGPHIKINERLRLVVLMNQDLSFSCAHLYCCCLCCNSSTEYLIFNIFKTLLTLDLFCIMSIRIISGLEMIHMKVQVEINLSCIKMDSDLFTQTTSSQLFGRRDVLRPSCQAKFFLMHCLYQSASECSNLISEKVLLHFL